MVRIVAFADSHGRHNKLVVPDGDLLVCAGDFCMGHGREEILPFLDWFHQQADRFPSGAVFVAGNHDLGLDPERPKYEDSLCDMVMRGTERYLENELARVAGLDLYGSPRTPKFGRCAAFMLDCGPAIAAAWKLIPDVTDVLVTHGPPMGLGDVVRAGSRNLGCQDLARRVSELPNLKLHLFGHIHGSGGFCRPVGQTLFANVSVTDESYRLVRNPFVFDIEI